VIFFGFIIFIVLPLIIGFGGVSLFIIIIIVFVLLLSFLIIILIAQSMFIIIILVILVIIFLIIFILIFILFIDAMLGHILGPMFTTIFASLADMFNRVISFITNVLWKLIDDIVDRIKLFLGYEIGDISLSIVDSIRDIIFNMFNQSEVPVDDLIRNTIDYFYNLITNIITTVRERIRNYMPIIPLLGEQGTELIRTILDNRIDSIFIDLTNQIKRVILGTTYFSDPDEINTGKNIIDLIGEMIFRRSSTDVRLSETLENFILDLLNRNFLFDSMLTNIGKFGGRFDLMSVVFDFLVKIINRLTGKNDDDDTDDPPPTGGTGEQKPTEEETDNSKVSNFKSRLSLLFAPLSSVPFNTIISNFIELIKDAFNKLRSFSPAEWLDDSFPYFKDVFDDFILVIKDYFIHIINFNLVDWLGEYVPYFQDVIDAFLVLIKDLFEIVLPFNLGKNR